MTLLELEQCFGEDFDNMFADDYEAEHYIKKINPLTRQETRSYVCVGNNWLRYDVVKGWFVKYMLQREFSLNEEKIKKYEKALNIEEGRTHETTK